MTEQIRGWSSTSMTHLSSGSHHSLTFATATGKQAVTSNSSGLREFQYLGIERVTSSILKSYSKPTKSERGELNLFDEFLSNKN